MNFHENLVLLSGHCILATIIEFIAHMDHCYSFLLGGSPQIMPIPLSQKYKMITPGCPIILQCEVSDPVAQVSWFKDQVELYSKTGLDMKRDGCLRKLMIQSAKVSDSGLYSCSLIDNVVTFHVDVKGDCLVFSLNQ